MVTFRLLTQACLGKLLWFRFRKRTRANSVKTDLMLMKTHTVAEVGGRDRKQQLGRLERRRGEERGHDLLEIGRVLSRRTRLPRDAGSSAVPYHKCTANMQQTKGTS